MRTKRSALSVHAPYPAGTATDAVTLWKEPEAGATPGESFIPNEVSGPSPALARPKPEPPFVHFVAKSLTSKSSVKRLTVVGYVLRISVPGAPTSTDLAPQSEKLASWSAWSVAATQITLSTAPEMPDVCGS